MILAWENYINYWCGNQSLARSRPAVWLLIAAVMASLLHSESRRLYSWWWDSHISPRNSKWLQENLTDMDAKVKAMIKLIEEDADSFARRAEMYYKKRPELMKLVEEFYRAYRALAERYDNATGELRQAHRTMAQAFPDQVPFVLGDDTPSNSEPETPETPHPIRAFFDPEYFKGLSASSSHGMKRNGPCSEESDAGSTRTSRKGLKQLNDMFRSGEGAQESRSSDGRTKRGQNSQEAGGELSQLSKENQELRSQIVQESERAKKAETELQNLREALAKLEAERNAILEKLSTLEKDLSHVQKDSRGLDILADGAKFEIQSLKEALKSLEAERDASVLQYRQASERLAAVEALIHQAQEDAKGWNEKAVQAEAEREMLKQELERFKSEKEAGEQLYREYLEKIASMEKKLQLAEESLRFLGEQSKRAENEVKNLKEEIGELNAERDAVTLQYEQCLETISNLEHELNEARAENSQLNSEIMLSSAKLKGAEDQCVLLGKMNESLQLEAQSLSKKIAAADEELSRKQSELEKLMASLQDEHSRFVKAEATLHALQNLHFQSQEEQRALALELRNGLQMMKGLEISKQDLDAEIQLLKYENQTLNNLNSSSAISQKNLQDELLKLKELKGKFEAQVKHQTEQSDALQLQVHNLKEEIEGLYGRYQALMKQIEFVGLDPESFVSSVRNLQDDNLRLEEITKKDKAERDVLLKKLQDMDELLKKNAILESSLSEVNDELIQSKAEVKALKEFGHKLNEEKSNIITEKAALLSQLQIITETMQNLLEMNTSLQTSLCSANAELEGLRAKSKGLEDFCQLLNSERSNLQAERSALISRLEIVEQKVEKLEMRFSNLEDKYAGLEKEKQSKLNQVEDLRISLDVEKQERACLALTSEARLSGLEGHIQDLQEENKHRKKEFEEQLEKAVNAQVEIFILQKFIQDMEDKNYSLLVECQRHVEAAKYSEKLITELEGENMMQQVEAEILLDKIDMLREGISQVMKALGVQHGSETEAERNFVPCVLANIRNIKTSLSESKDENQQLLIEKSILSTIIGQLHFECVELSSKKTALEQESLMLMQHLMLLENERHHLLERSRQLNREVDERERREVALKAEVDDLHEKQAWMQGSCVALEDENLKAFAQNRFIMEELSHIKEEKHILEEENAAILIDALAFSYQSLILKSCAIEKASELDKVFEHVSCLGEAYRSLENEAKQLEGKLLMKEIENSALRASMEKLEEEQLELNAFNHQLRCQISDGKELQIQKELELSETEQKLKAVEAMKTELCSTIQCLEKEHQDLDVTTVVLQSQMVELSENSKFQEKEIVCLRAANGSLESEVGKLHEEIEEYKIREVILASELHERNGDFELWETEAASFYFDLQISSVREALLENKVHELGSLCEGLEDFSKRRSVEIERLKERVCSLESEAEALKSQLTTCLPLIASLKEHIALLEQNPVLQSKLLAAGSAEQKGSFAQTKESSSSPGAVLELQKLQSRIKVIEGILEKEKEMIATQECGNANIRLETALKEIEELRSQISTLNQEDYQQSARYSVSVTSEAKIGTEMKDIPLDRSSSRSFRRISQRGNAESDEQMLELWEAAEQESVHDQSIIELQNQGTDPIEDEIVYAHSGALDQPSLDPTPESHFEKELGVDRLELSRKGCLSSQKGTKKTVLERLTSDAQKLLNLQISVQDLRRKIEPTKRRRKAEDVEYDSFRGQLQALENSMVQLMDMNTELMKTSDESSLTLDGRLKSQAEEAESIRHKQVSEQAKKEAEKIARLELEMQRIRYVLERSVDEKKTKGRGSVSRSSAAILLRDFFYSRGRKSKKPKKSRLCGCLRPSAAKN